MASNFSFQSENTNGHSTAYPSSSNDPNSYGTFLGNSDDSLPVTTSFNPHSFGSREPTILILGICPACKTGMIKTDFTCFGIFCAIIFFPIGLLCCWAFRQSRCNFCGAIYN